MSTLSETSTPPAAAALSKAAAAKPAKPTRTRTIVLSIVGLAVAVWLGRFIWHLYTYETTDDAYVVAHVHQIGPQLEGSVKAVLVEDNQLVKAGDVLVQLDSLQRTIALEKARAGEAQAQAQQAQARAAASQADGAFAEAQARVGQAKAQQLQAKAQYDLAKLSNQRNLELLNSGSGSIAQQDVDASKSALEVAESMQAASAANLRAAEASVVSAQAAGQSAAAAAQAAQATAEAATAAIRDAQRELDLMVIRAPADGRVGNRSVEVGSPVQAGQALLALVEPYVWIVANFKETQLGKIKAGMDADITVDALSGLKLHGKVDSIAPASGAQFALLPADNATGNFTKVVQRVPVKIVLDAASAQQAEGALRPGLSVGVEIRVR